MVDFDPPNLDTVTSQYIQDLYIQKYDINGNSLFVKTIGGPFSQIIAFSIKLDPSGNIYVSGQFTNSPDFDPGPSVFTLNSNGIFNVFVLKLDPNGDFLWAKSMPSTGRGLPWDMDVDSSGNIYLGGYFQDTIDVDPGPAIVQAISNGTQDMFIQKLDNNGNLVWFHQFGDFFGLPYISGVHLDDFNNLYITGNFTGTADFDPGPGVYNLNSPNISNLFLLKLDKNANFQWVKTVQGLNTNSSQGVETDKEGNLFLTGGFSGTADFDPGIGTYNLTALAQNTHSVFVLKLDSSGIFQWVSSGGSNFSVPGRDIAVDNLGNVYVTGIFQITTDFDFGVGVHNLTPLGFEDIFILKLDPDGDFLWAGQLSSSQNDNPTSIHSDGFRNIFVTGSFEATLDFDINAGVHSLTPTNRDAFLVKLKQSMVIGKVYNDLNQDCNQDSVELGLANRLLEIQPGNLVSMTNAGGIWGVDSLTAGSYTVTVDTNGFWIPTCPTSQIFNVVHPDSLTIVDAFGFIASSACPLPDVSIHAPILRPGFSNQLVFVNVCNQHTGTGSIDSAYVIVELNNFLTVNLSTIPYTNLGNNRYRVDIGTLTPGFCTDFYLSCSVNPQAILGQSLCMQAEVFPSYSCYLDTLPKPLPSNFQCLGAYDQSHLDMEAYCQNDSVIFNIINTGTGNMNCYLPVRLYIDAQMLRVDSVQLLAGDSAQFSYTGDGRTWRMETQQHPLHPGLSFPSATIELCGNPSNWTANLVNSLPHDDLNPQTDIFCGLVQGSYDPNDKTGFPLGTGIDNDILPGQELDYLIRFQNTGTDTAFNIVIRDTLSLDFDIFSVRSGNSSHDYTFRMYGPRVLEWTFSNIMLPDSNINEALSHGFVQFKVQPKVNLSLGTQLENTAAIYFDFNAPIITNTSQHTIDTLELPNWDAQVQINVSSCDSFSYNEFSYTQSGIYLQSVQNGGLDSLLIIDYTNLSSQSIIYPVACSSYIAPDSQVYNASGHYTAILTNAIGCDSIIDIQLFIPSPTFDTIAAIGCNDYLAPNNQIYNSSGQHQVIIPNNQGCDSIITLNLTINQVDTAIIQNGAQFLSSAFSGQLQWLQCDSNYAPISGATTPSFTALGNGYYAIQVTQNGCTDTSSCYPFFIAPILSSPNPQNWSLYPNPTQNLASIDLASYEEIIEIYINNSLGQLVQKINLTHRQIVELNLEDFSPGLYSIQIRTNTKLGTYLLRKL